MKPRFFTPFTILCLLLIAAGVGLAMWESTLPKDRKKPLAIEAPVAEDGTPLPLPAPESSAADGLEEKTDLGMIKLQSKLLVAAAQQEKSAALKQAEGLTKLVKSAEGARALGALFYYLGATNEALDLMDDHGAKEAEVDIIMRRLVSSDDVPSTTEAAVLEKEMGWFGKLLLAKKDPGIQAALAESSMQLLGIIILGFILVGAAGLAGTVLAVTAFIMRINGQLKFHLEPSENGRFYVQAFALYFAGMLLVPTLIHFLGFKAPAWNFVVIGGAMLLGLVWPLICRVPFRTFLYEMGIHRGKGVAQEIAAGLIGYMAMLPLMALGLLITGALQILSAKASGEAAEPITHPVHGMMDGAGPGEIAIVLLLASVAAPIAEELMFRGALQRGLNTVMAGLMSVLLMGFIFAAVHPQGIFAIPALMCMGVGFGLIRAWRGSIIGSTIVHGVHNGMLVGLLVLLTR